MRKLGIQGKAVVVGAGVMGAQIAAHLINAGWEVSLLDIPLECTPSDLKVRNQMSNRGLDRALKARPPAFFLPDMSSRVRTGNTIDNLDWLKNADWVIEAVVEKPDIKKALHCILDSNIGSNTLITTNTSGLSIAGMAAECSASYRSRFFGTHFFNPPRYMKLLEIIRTPDTDASAIEAYLPFAESLLGKRIVFAHDTPGFIANRLGIYASLHAMHATLSHGLSVEEVDAITGPIVGHPKSATYRLNDIVGLDITADVANNLSTRLPDNNRRAMLSLPDPIKQLLSEGRIGEKSGSGFYRRESDKTILALDWASMEYQPRKNPVFSSFDAVKSLPLAERLRAITKLQDPAGKFLWETTRDIICYAAEIANEIADDITAIDDAIRWGFNWELGPFQIWDALGVAETVSRIEYEGLQVPALVQSLLKSNQSSFYTTEKGVTSFTVLNSPGEKRKKEEKKDFIVLQDLKNRGSIIKATPDATLIDLGDGVNCLEFHTKMNVLGPGITQLLDWSRQETERNGVALVIGNQGQHFSAGFNIQLFLMSIYEQDWDEMLLMTQQLQEIVLRLKRSSVPIVTAVQGYALGGGLEVGLHCSAIQAAAESYIGLPEAGIGVIPGGGGTTEMLVRAQNGFPPDGATDTFPFIHKAFEIIGMAKVSTCAVEARGLGYLRPTDGISMNSDRLIYEAKQKALSLANTSFRPDDPAKIWALGEDGIARFEAELHNMQRSRFISEHDRLIGSELAKIMCGGELVHPQIVSEEYVLGLEREAFVRLCSTPKTVDRIKHMLETGKPLRN